MLCLVVCLLWLFGVVVDDGQGHAQEDDSGFLRRTFDRTGIEGR